MNQSFSKENSNPKQNLVMNGIYRFIGGSAIGTILLLIPYSLSSVEPSLPYIGIAVSLVILCGLLSSILGKSFIEALLRLLESFGS